MNFSTNAKIKLAYHKGIRDGIEYGTFKFLGMFKDLKEDFETSFRIEGQEDDFKTLIPTHLVYQPLKPSHPYRVTLDMSHINDKMFNKGPSLIPYIAKVVARLRAHTYLFSVDIRKHYWQIKTQNPQS